MCDQSARRSPATQYRLDRTRFDTVSLHALGDEGAYRRTRTPEERTAAIERFGFPGGWGAELGEFLKSDRFFEWVCHLYGERFSPA